MKLFGKRREAKPLAQHQEKMAENIAGKIVAVQSSLAAKLNAQAQKIGMARTKLLLGAVLLGFAAYCAWLMLSVLF